MDLICSQHFWQYSINRYSLETVKNALINLQDEFGINVNLVLFIMYLSHQGVFITERLVLELRQAIEELDSLVTIQRHKRRALKNLDKLKYQQALAEELDMEKAIQATLVNSFNDLIDNKNKALQDPLDSLACLSTGDLAKMPRLSSLLKLLAENTTAHDL